VIASLYPEPLGVEADVASLVIVIVLVPVLKALTVLEPITNSSSWNIGLPAEIAVYNGFQFPLSGLVEAFP
jgi:hypothetical protein